MGLSYRKDIDGLRAIAVSGVVVFHAFPWLLSGGYIGVDVFFVISGYLITAIIVRQAQNGSFSLWGFYERRFRRIIPALTVVLVASTFAATVILPPHELRPYGKSLVSVALFGSNIQFWIDGGYFDGPAEAKPLLHTWSLAVEEQFYLIWPPIVAGLIGLGRSRLLKSVVWLTIIISLLAAEFIVRSAPTAAFFLLPFRAWELGLGALLSIGAIPTVRHRVVAQIEAVAGLCLIGGSMMVMTDQTRFPGLSAFPACLGTALLIHAGQSGTTYVGRLLSVRPILFTGLISYSFYLWHWPVLSLGRIVANGSFSAAHAAIAVGVAYVLAAASLYYVEKPFRSGELPLLNRAHVIAGTALTAGVLGVVGLGLVATHGLYRFASSEVQTAEAATASVSAFRKACHADRALGSVGALKACTGGARVESGGYDVLLWGDSHADHLMPGLAKIASEDGWSVRQVSVSGCDPLGRYLGQTNVPSACYKTFRSGLIEASKQHDLRAVVFGMRWTNKLSNFVKTAQDNGLTTTEALKAFQQAARLTIRDIHNIVGEDVRIIVIGSLPEYDIWPATCVARAAKLHQSLLVCENTEQRNDIWGIAADNLLSDLASEQVKVILPRNRLCSTGKCNAIENRMVLFRDDDHLTNEGSEYLAGYFRPFINVALQKRSEQHVSVRPSRKIAMTSVVKGRSE